MKELEKPDVQKLQQMKRDRKGLYDQAKAFQTGMEDTAENRGKLDKMLTEVETLSVKIEQEERMLAISDTLAAHADFDKDRDPESPDAKRSAAFNDFLRNGIAGMKPENRQFMVVAEARGIGPASGGGAYIVPESFYNKVVDVQKAFGGMRASGATILTTSGGNDIPVPKGDDTANTGEIVTDGGYTTTADPTFTQMILKAYMYSSKIVRVAIALLQDEAVNLEALLATWLGMRIARITNTHFTTGNDSDQPDGVMNSAADSSVVTASNTAITYGELVQLQHALDPAYQAGGRYMFNNGTLSVIKQMKTSTEGIPLWLPGVAAREPDTILGKPYTVNQDMPNYASGQKAIIFGDFSNYFIRDVRGASLLRLVERYAEYLQVGFLMYSRHDAGLAVPSAIKYLKAAT